MQGRTLISSVAVVVLLFALQQVVAQQQQALRIVKGKKVTLRADAQQALSYIWFRNGESINGEHESRITVTEGGTYNVIALGDGCNSDISDPVEIIVDPLAEDVHVDIEIRNLPDRERALVSQEFNYQLLVLNNGNTAADELLITFKLPRQLVYTEGIQETDKDLQYNPGKKELVWKLARLESKESASRWIKVRGEFSGQAITTARVISKQQDIDPTNNEDQAAVDIVTLFIPNVITPNGDGKNDTFEVVGLDAFKSNKLIIFNRFGNEVFRSINYQNNWSGENLKEGTYFYYLEIEDGTGVVHRNKGYVLLMRKIAYP